MKAYKFLIPADVMRWASNPDFCFQGMVAVVVAESKEDATARLSTYCDEQRKVCRPEDAARFDPRWIALANVVEIELRAGEVLTYVAL